MNSRPLLDYLASSDEDADAATESRRLIAGEPEAATSFDALEARLRDLEARLRAPMPPVSPPVQDLTLSAQIEAILKRKASLTAMPQQAKPSREAAEQPSRRARLAIDPPPSVPSLANEPSIDPEFAKFAEAVYLMGQAARRFADEPHVSAAPAASAAPSTADIVALSAILRETVSACRSVADDLAVSAAEIRSFATRNEQPRRDARAFNVDAEVLELRDTVTELRSLAGELAVSRREVGALAAHGDRGSSARRNDRHPRDDADEIRNLREIMIDLQHRLETLEQARHRARY
jgi:hypothetical protein